MVIWNMILKTKQEADAYAIITVRDGLFGTPEGVKEGLIQVISYELCSYGRFTEKSRVAEHIIFKGEETEFFMMEGRGWIN